MDCAELDWFRVDIDQAELWLFPLADSEKIHDLLYIPRRLWFTAAQDWAGPDYYAESDSALYGTTRSLLQPCTGLRWAWFSTVQDNAESYSALYRTALSLIQNCPVQDNAEPDSVLYRTTLSLFSNVRDYAEHDSALYRTALGLIQHCLGLRWSWFIVV